MAKDKKISAAKQRILDNFKQQRQLLLDKGYSEKPELISIVQANLRVFLTALPWVAVGIVLWILVKKSGSTRNRTVCGRFYNRQSSASLVESAEYIRGGRGSGDYAQCTEVQEA